MDWTTYEPLIDVTDWLAVVLPERLEAVHLPMRTVVTESCLAANGEATTPEIIGSAASSAAGRE